MVFETIMFDLVNKPFFEAHEVHINTTAEVRKKLLLQIVVDLICC